jgi:SAM-dependent methyltransferase
MPIHLRIGPPGGGVRQPLLYARAAIRRVLVKWSEHVQARRPGAQQFSHSTKEDRYPDIFAGVAGMTRPFARILSFGCSTGEEPAALASYFPDTTVVGADISPTVVAGAVRRCAELGNVVIVNSDRQRLQDLGPFDVVFAMSVLCRHPLTAELENCAPIYPFSTFENACEQLAQLLTEEGLLVVYNANYRFTDTRVAESFVPVDIPGVTESGFVTKFGVDGHRLSDQTYRHCVFQRHR